MTSLDLHGAPIEAIVADLEGVVIDTETLWDEGARIFLAARSKRYEPLRTKRLCVGKSLFESSVVLCREYDLSDDPEDLSSERRQVMLDLMSTEVQFVTGFKEFMEQIDDKVRYAAASSMDPELFRLADAHLGLTELFRGHIILAEGDVRPKPHPDVYRVAMNGIGANPSTTMAIEDAPSGIESAHAAGAYCVGITTSVSGAHLSAADLVFDEFEELFLHLTGDFVRRDAHTNRHFL